MADARARQGALCGCVGVLRGDRGCRGLRGGHAGRGPRVCVVSRLNVCALGFTSLWELCLACTITKYAATRSPRNLDEAEIRQYLLIMADLRDLARKRVCTSLCSAVARCSGSAMRRIFPTCALVSRSWMRLASFLDSCRTPLSKQAFSEGYVRAGLRVLPGLLPSFISADSIERALVNTTYFALHSVETVEYSHAAGSQPGTSHVLK